MPLKKYERVVGCDGKCSMKKFLSSLGLIIFGPLFLLFVCLRCEKNQCVLLQLPMVFPTHMSAYFSTFSVFTLVPFLLVTFLTNRLSAAVHKKGKHKDGTQYPPTIGCLLGLSLLMLCIAYIKPGWVLKLRSEYLRILCTTIGFCLLFSFGLAVLAKVNLIKKDGEFCFLMGYVHGFSVKMKFHKIDLKYYFYVNVGFVAWALVDLLIFISFVLEKPVTAPLLFIFITQYIFVLHTLLFEKFLMDRPFMYTEGLGFFWLMRVLLITPFLFSLPLLYASATEISIPKPAMLANCGLFMFGFVIYVSSLHQRESFLATQSAQKSMKTIMTNTGRRLLVGGYWGTVQKPDYLGYLIMWLSWTVACGFSPVALIVLMLVCCIVLFWLKQRDQFHRDRYGSAWNRYTTLVPHKIIPMVY